MCIVYMPARPLNNILKNAKQMQKNVNGYEIRAKKEDEEEILEEQRRRAQVIGRKFKKRSCLVR